MSHELSKIEERLTKNEDTAHKHDLSIAEVTHAVEAVSKETKMVGEAVQKINSTLEKTNNHLSASHLKDEQFLGVLRSVQETNVKMQEDLEYERQLRTQCKDEIIERVETNKKDLSARLDKLELKVDSNWTWFYRGLAAMSISLVVYIYSLEHKEPLKAVKPQETIISIQEGHKHD